jgi:hypothetical protein
MHNGVQTNPKQQEIPFELTITEAHLQATAADLWIISWIALNQQIGREEHLPSWWKEKWNNQQDFLK